ncbi:hypothetical protein Y1Q_0010621 [Alligator mississippiensis]|uniref:Uncharacterized protein n=1 Tax=Alligator mississippiensis TaxID=8496 RepID=A0A151PGI5_ALLMI|nr:hypothetical protein Y1Q_0010621 [Alligator mississippiensis]
MLVSVPLEASKPHKKKRSGSNSKVKAIQRGEKVAGNTYIILAAAVSILLAFGAGSLWFYRRRKEYKDRQYRPPCDQPESADSSSAGQSSASLSITEAKE